MDSCIIDTFHRTDWLYRPNVAMDQLIRVPLVTYMYGPKQTIEDNDNHNNNCLHGDSIERTTRKPSRKPLVKILSGIENLFQLARITNEILVHSFLLVTEISEL